ncbi:hypothetical protein EJ02DRAFT_171026 [Clathrospora elynae]|uniref:Uncharacterized protein n=1 Tax=Clathrospora elynae TaxID=706981 RepID=A0A6A5T341_9PLEO|nr:hypothetical protein EJ02DRAFT_171026 [Clathrospora elynae]
MSVKCIQTGRPRQTQGLHLMRRSELSLFSYAVMLGHVRADIDFRIVLRGAFASDWTHRTSSRLLPCLKSANHVRMAFDVVGDSDNCIPYCSKSCGIENRRSTVPGTFESCRRSKCSDRFETLMMLLINERLQIATPWRIRIDKVLERWLMFSGFEFAKSQLKCRRLPQSVAWTCRAHHMSISRVLQGVPELLRSMRAA